MIKILFAGDFAPRARVTQLIEEGNYSDVLSEVLPYTSNSDYSVINLEAPVVNMKSTQGIDKYGPHLSCTSHAIGALKYAGFNLVTLANNHLNDYGPTGVLNTLDLCKEADLDTVGAGADLSKASITLFKEIKGKVFAFINCCEHEFSVATEELPGANPLNPVCQFRAITEAKLKADYVIVIVHGGHEHYQLPSPRMKELYRFYADVGADVVINHHQHCYSGYEKYKESMIFYGLGNFCFDIVPHQVNNPWNFGYMVELSFDKTMTYKILPYNQCGSIAKVEMLSLDAFDIYIEELNSIILDDKILQFKTEEYYKSSQSWEYSVLEPYRGRVANKLFSLGLLPKFVKGRKIPQILNHVECESHRDKLIYALRKRLK